ncbi:MAG: hypothetical protein OXC62_03715 [Aestuariivita sp.]|nr:hypothetical protein [Aestuariivita sp.]
MDITQNPKDRRFQTIDDNADLPLLIIALLQQCFLIVPHCR